MREGATVVGGGGVKKEPSSKVSKKSLEGGVPMT